MQLEIRVIQIAISYVTDSGRMTSFSEQCLIKTNITIGEQNAVLCYNFTQISCESICDEETC